MFRGQLPFQDVEVTLSCERQAETLQHTRCLFLDRFHLSLRLGRCLLEQFHALVNIQQLLEFVRHRLVFLLQLVELLVRKPSAQLRLVPQHQVIFRDLLQLAVDVLRFVFQVVHLLHLLVFLIPNYSSCAKG